MLLILNEGLYVQPYCGHKSGLEKSHREGLLYRIPHFCYTFKDQRLINQSEVEIQRSTFAGPATEKSFLVHIFSSVPTHKNRLNKGEPDIGACRVQRAASTTSIHFSEYNLGNFLFHIRKTLTSFQPTRIADPSYT